MKATFRLPTREYAYIEVEFEGTQEEMLQQYFELEGAYRTAAKTYKTELDKKIKEEEPPF